MRFIRTMRVIRAMRAMRVIRVIRSDQYYPVARCACSDQYQYSACSDQCKRPVQRVDLNFDELG